METEVDLLTFAAYYYHVSSDPSAGYEPVIITSCLQHMYVFISLRQKSHLFCSFVVCVCVCVCQLAPTCSSSLVNSMKIVQNPVATCDQVYALIQSLTSQIRKRMEDPKSAGESLSHSR